MSKFRTAVATVAVAGLSAATANAQLNNQWLTYAKDTTRIVNPNGTTATQVTTNPDEKDFCWGDVNNDGWIDLAMVCKAPQSQLPNKRVNYLLINENGKLVDRTSQFATDSDVPGDFGFATATADREVLFVDVNNDGWKDMVTATTLSDGDTKVISHPRIYMNKGQINGLWQGFRFENARFPQLMTIAATPLAVAPRFCGMAIGDVDGDGFVDIYLADYDTTEPPGAINEPANWDLNDRLLMNDGTGNFIDSLETRMTTQMLFSTFGTHAMIIDINGDTFPDIIKNTALNSATYDSASYQDPLNPGTFNIFQQITVANGQPYHFDIADLNHDNRPDLIVGDDATDYVKYNTGTDMFGRVIWGANVNHTWLTTGGDDGFPGTTVMADLNNDGWTDLVQSDVDVDLFSCSRRLHIFRNPGGTVGGQWSLREEAEFTSSSNGWKGVVGMTVPEMRGTWDCATFDLDNDGDIDIIQGRCNVVSVWLNQLNPAPTITSYCAGDGTGTACPCGNNSLAGAGEGCLDSFGLGAKLAVSGIGRVSTDTLKLNGSRMPNGGPALYFQGTAQLGGGAGIAFGDGKLCLTGTLIRLGVKFNSGTGTSTYPVGADPILSVAGFVASGDTRTYQAWYRDSAAFCDAATHNLTNGMQVIWAP